MTGHFVPGGEEGCDSLTWTVSDLIEATGVKGSIVDPPVCGPNNNVLTTPFTEGVTYSDTGWINNQRTITAAANPGYVLDGESSWTFIDTPVEGCPDEGAVFSYTPQGDDLAYTGTSSSTSGLTALAIFLMTTGTALVALKVRAR